MSREREEEDPSENYKICSFTLSLPLSFFYSFFPPILAAYHMLLHIYKLPCLHLTHSQSINVSFKIKIRRKKSPTVNMNVRRKNKHCSLQSMVFNFESWYVNNHMLSFCPFHLELLAPRPDLLFSLLSYHIYIYILSFFIYFTTYFAFKYSCKCDILVKVKNIGSNKLEYSD